MKKPDTSLIITVENGQYIGNANLDGKTPELWLAENSWGSYDKETKWGDRPVFTGGAIRKWILDLYEAIAHPPIEETQSIHGEKFEECIFSIKADQDNPVYLHGLKKTKLPALTIKFYLNGGSTTDSTETDDNGEYLEVTQGSEGAIYAGDTLGSIKPNVTLTRNGYTLAGWATSSNGHVVDDNFQITDTTTFYAVWLSSQDEFKLLVFNNNSLENPIKTIDIKFTSGWDGKTTNKKPTSPYNTWTSVSEQLSDNWKGNYFFIPVTSDNIIYVCREIFGESNLQQLGNYNHELEGWFIYEEDGLNDEPFYILKAQ